MISSAIILIGKRKLLKKEIDKSKRVTDDETGEIKDVEETTSPVPPLFKKKVYLLTLLINGLKGTVNWNCWWISSLLFGKPGALPRDMADLLSIVQMLDSGIHLDDLISFIVENSRYFSGQQKDVYCFLLVNGLIDIIKPLLNI